MRPVAMIPTRSHSRSTSSFRRWCPPLTELYRDVVLSAGRRREPRRSPFRGGGMSTALRAPGRHAGGAAGVRRAGAVAQLRDRDGRHDRAVAVFGPVGAFVAGQSSRKSLGVAPSAAGVLPAIMAAARTQGLEVPLQPVDDAAGRAAVADGSPDGCSPAHRVPSSSSGGTAWTPGWKRWSTRPCALRDHHPVRAHPEHAERSARRARRDAVALPFFSQTVMPAPCAGCGVAVRSGGVGAARAGGDRRGRAAGRAGVPQLHPPVKPGEALRGR